MLRAIYSFFYGGTPATFASAYTVHQSVERLRAATKRSVFGALGAQASVGTVTESHVSLQRVIPFIGNSCKPFFVGHFEPTADGTRLVGQFTMHWLAKMFSTGWFGFCLIWTMVAFGSASASGRSGNWGHPVFGIGMLVAGGLGVHFSKWCARHDAAWLSTVITNALSNKPSA